MSRMDDQQLDRLADYAAGLLAPAEEAQVSKVVSLIVKLGALLFVFFLDRTAAINFQLLGGIWILQTLPAVVIGLYTRWFHRWALLLGWAALATLAFRRR